MKNERTGKKAASIAGKILAKIAIFEKCQANGIEFGGLVSFGTIEELKTLCASALTQAPDKPKRKK